MGDESRSSGPVTRLQKQTFEEASVAAGIKATTLAKLIEEDFDSVAVLREMTDEDLEALEISRGQRRLLQKWRHSLVYPNSAPEKPKSQSVVEQSSSGSAQVSSDVTAQSLAKDPDVGQVLESMRDALPGDQLWNDPSSAIAREVRDSWDEQKTAGKALLIPDFVSRISASADDNNEQEVIRSGSSQLVLRSARARLVPEHVTLAQWISANSRIMAKLITTGQLSSQQQILDYLQYVADVGDYAQTCEQSSVMIYDHEYRKKQAAFNRKWGDDDIHLCTFFLNKKARSDRRYQGRSNHQMSRSSNKPPRLVDNSGLEICRNFNGYGCSRQPCYFSHVCSICKDKSHPRSRHEQSNH